MKILPSLPALMAGLMLAAPLVGFAPSAQAADDLAVEGNTIIRAYSLYCEPTYYNAHKLGDGQWNPDLVESYGRTLLIRYNANCDTFWARGVAPAEATYQLTQTVPELQRDGGGILTDRQAQALGKQFWIDAFYDRYGCNRRQGADQRVAYDRVLAPYWQKVGASDTQNIGTGYAALEVLRTIMGVDPNESADFMCSLGIGFFAPLTGDVFGAQLATPEEIEAAMPAPADSRGPVTVKEHGEPTPAANEEIPPAEPGRATAPTAEHSSAPIAPQPIQDSSADAVEALTKLSGWWWYEDEGNGCNDTDNQARLALGSWHWDDSGEIIFGEGPFAIGIYEGRCELSELSLTGNSIRFHGECTVEGEESSGAGSITMTGSDAAVVKLPHLDIGFTIRACPVSEHVSANASPLSRLGGHSVVPLSQVRQDEPFSATSQVSTFLVSIVGKLPKGPYRQEQDTCMNEVIVPITPAGRYVRDRGWGVIAEQPIGSLQLVAFAGEFIGGTSGTCAFRQGNVAIFAGDRLQAILYTAKKSDELIGQLKPKEDGEVRLWSGEYLPQPVADLAIDGNALTVKQLSASEPFCSGAASVPNIYGLPITDARQQLQAAGWQPVPQPKEEFGQQPHLQDIGVTEAETCSGTGMAFCSYAYRGQDATLHVTTAGELYEDDIPGVAFYDVDCMGS